MLVLCYCLHISSCLYFATLFCMIHHVCVFSFLFLLLFYPKHNKLVPVALAYCGFLSIILISCFICFHGLVFFESTIVCIIYFVYCIFSLLLFHCSICYIIFPYLGNIKLYVFCLYMHLVESYTQHQL